MRAFLFLTCAAALVLLPLPFGVGFVALVVIGCHEEKARAKRAP